MLKLYYKKQRENSLNHRLQDQQQQQRVRAQSEMAAAQTMIPPHLSQHQQQQSGILPSIHGNEQQQLISSGPTREEVLSAQVQSLQVCEYTSTVYH